MKRLSHIFTVLVFLFLYLPMIVLGVASFNAGTDIASWEGFTLSQYTALFRDGTLLPLLRNSVIVAVAAALISTVLGTMAAVGIYNMKKRPKALSMTLTNIPMTNPDIVTGVSLALLFAFVGTILRKNHVMGFGTLLKEAALDLGCTPMQAFFRVVIHEILPGIISGALMAFTMSLDDFVISYFVYGPSFVTLPVEIYNYTKKPLPPKIYALFTLLFLVILVLMVLMNLLQLRDSRKAARHGTRKGAAL